MTAITAIGSDVTELDPRCSVQVQQGEYVL